MEKLFLKEVMYMGLLDAFEAMYMGLLDVFKEEESANLRLDTLYELFKQIVQKESIINGINCDVLNKYVREIITGNSESNVLPIYNSVVEEREE